MSIRLQTSRRTAWRETVRIVAVLFLVLACADLALPQVCAEDSEPLFQAQTAPAPTFAHADDSGEPLPHPAQTEDCFCCCSHIVSEDAGSPLGALAVVSGSGRIAVPPIPAARVQVLFHPPRLA